MANHTEHISHVAAMRIKPLLHKLWTSVRQIPVVCGQGPECCFIHPAGWLAGWLLFLETRNIEMEQKETQGGAVKVNRPAIDVVGNIMWPNSLPSRGCRVWFT